MKEILALEKEISILTSKLEKGEGVEAKLKKAVKKLKKRVNKLNECRKRIRNCKKGIPNIFT